MAFVSVDFLLGIAVGGFGYFLLDNALYPWLARIWADHRRLLRGR